LSNYCDILGWVNTNCLDRYHWRFYFSCILYLV